MQAAIGVAQLEKLPYIVEIRKKNWNILYNGLKDLQDKIILPEPEKNSKPSWFGFLITIKEGNEKSRVELAKYLESNKIQTRNLFAGNLTKHPAFDEMRKTGEGFKIIGDLKNTNFIMNNTLWIGVYPGMTNEMLNFMIKKIREYILK
jgi:CDP-6-deoxy-D-xylo-4-hexulose-3-dehydrase